MNTDHIQTPTISDANIATVVYGEEELKGARDLADEILKSTSAGGGDFFRNLVSTTLPEVQA